MTMVYCLCYGQKPPITFDTYKTWPEVGNGNLSANGKYAFYYIRNQPQGKNTVKVTTTTGRELLSIVDLTDPKFSADSKYLFGKLPGDSLTRIDLSSGKVKYVPKVALYNLEYINKIERLIYVDIHRTLTVSTTDFHQLFTLGNVEQYWFSPERKILVAECKDSNDKSVSMLRWLSLDKFTERTIFKGSAIEQPIFDRFSKQMAFISFASDQEKKIFLYQDGKEAAMVLVDKTKLESDSSFVINAGEFWRFSYDCSRLFFDLAEPRNGRLKKPSKNFELWSYQDAFLGGQWYGKNGASESVLPRNYLSVVDLNSQKCQRLLKDDEKVVFNTFNQTTDSVLVIESSFGDTDEQWNKSANATFSLLNTQTGARNVLEEKITKYIFNWSLSPYGRFVVYYDRSTQNYVCYDMRLQQKKDISSKIDDSFIYFHRRHFPLPDFQMTRPEWFEGNKILMYGTYDLWCIDPTGKEQAKNLSKGMGTKNGIIFLPLRSRSNGIMSKDDQLLVSGFNVNSKELGFYSLNTQGKPELRVRYVDDIFTGLINNFYTPLGYPEIIGNAHSGYIVKFEKSDNAANIYYTKDLHTFNTISNVQPQKSYNWLTSELYTYKDSLGRTLQGILYKPSDFDSSKKYPIIFNIYELKSQTLNAFLPVEPVSAEINIPLMVSNGYLVFLADTKGIIKKPGLGALLSVNAAIDRLSKNEWVDTSKMALVGHSFGGFETNYIISHSDRFAAAIVSAGPSSMTTNFLPRGSGRSKEEYLTADLPMMQDFIGKDPQAYIDNAPIFHAKNINTPVFFIHNDNDGAVNPIETKALFIVLRSLQKPSWWINYRGEGHGVLREENLMDYQSKVWEFLNYYLKNGEMPSWMKEHI